MLYFPKKNGLILHPYLPITATSPQRPLSSVPKVAIVEWFNCARVVLAKLIKNTVDAVIKTNHTTSIQFT